MTAPTQQQAVFTMMIRGAIGVIQDGLSSHVAKSRETISKHPDRFVAHLDGEIGNCKDMIEQWTALKKMIEQMIEQMKANKTEHP